MSSRVDPPPSEAVPLEREGMPSSQTDASLARWLRAVLVGAVLVPSIAFVFLVIGGYRRAQVDAEATVAHASALSLRQAQRLFQIAERVARRVEPAIPATDAEVRAEEYAIHQRLDDLVAGAPWVVNMNVWAADGHLLARSDAYPVDPGISVADRPYFVEQRDHAPSLVVGDVVTGRMTGRELFNVTIRRTLPDGRFNGIVAIAMSPEFFRDYYRSLASEQPNLASFVLAKNDGTLLVRWPQLTDGRTRVEDDNPIFARITRGERSGIVMLPARPGRESRIVHFRAAEGLPIWVTAGVSRNAMLADWLHFVALLAAFFGPITLGLVWVTWVALRKTHREQQLAARMQEETTRRAQAERAVLETQKFEALSQLTGGVAHDFNNLLTIVSNNLHILKRRHPAMAEERQMESMTRAVKAGVRLTRQLLSFSRKQALRPEIVRLQQWLPATEGLLRSVLGARIALHYRIEPDVDPIRVDLAELELALVNLALNTQHAMEGDGTLTIAAANAAASPPRVTISVTDNGPGIPLALVTKIFEPFFTTKGVGKGSGLGLSQVAGLCEQSGGSARAESEVGRGTSIRMTFPSAAADATVERQAEHAEATSSGGCVLLVEDNDDVAAVTEQLLHTAGFDVTRTANADDALAKLDAANGIDLVISDIAMPGSMDGIELAFTLQKRFPRLPVLLVTGFAERIDEAMRANLRVLSKPVPPGEILREASRLLQESRAASPG